MQVVIVIMVVVLALSAASAVGARRRRSRFRMPLARWAQARGLTLTWGRKSTYVFRGRVEHVDVSISGEEIWLGPSGPILVTQFWLHAPNPDRPTGWIGHVTGNDGREGTGDADFDARLCWSTIPSPSAAPPPGCLEDAGFRTGLLVLEAALASAMAPVAAHAGQATRSLFQVNLDPERVSLMTFYVGDAELLNEALSVLLDAVRSRR